MPDTQDIETREEPRTAQIEALAAELRERRRRQGLSLEALSARSGVSRSMISKVERGEAVPSTVVLSRLAEALGTTFAALMMPASTEHEVLVIPRARQPVLRDEATGFSRRVLSPVLPGRGLDVVLNTLPAGAETGVFTPHRSGVEEYVWVQRGRLRAQLGEAEVLLEAGDSLFFDATVPHAFSNPGEEPCEYLLVIDSSVRR
ncbi:helix-turn-helix domain-containing protein [Belnapia rosea]|uniref:Transcriptional regulator, XRE family with cupin sensor n=1 Tax=Belnapia rosea TaxID=938405 RepID=A0A1G6QH93_9PROT|nr:XRE family transcriptional regulator [Belnapia rosea]SDC91840.1 transcriptional regulator, XRE family with cupin sensor [Belnapia rosea]